MSNEQLNCLEDCRAACCRGGKVFLTGLTLWQTMQFLKDPRASIYEVKVDNKQVNGILMPEDCILENNRCPLHDTKLKPQVCCEVEPGGDICLSSRKDAGYEVTNVVKDTRRWVTAKDLKTP